MRHGRQQAAAAAPAAEAADTGVAWLYKPLRLFEGRECHGRHSHRHSHRHRHHRHHPRPHNHHHGTHTQQCPWPRCRCKPCAPSTAAKRPRGQTRARWDAGWSVQCCAPARWRRACAAYSTRSKTALPMRQAWSPARRRRRPTQSLSPSCERTASAPVYTRWLYK